VSPSTRFTPLEAERTRDVLRAPPMSASWSRSAWICELWTVAGEEALRDDRADVL
jgi:hypothetical protein